MSSFNVVVFVLAASLKPLAHVMTLLRERTFYLQSEMQASESQVQMLQRKLDLMEDELDTLRKAFATKKDLGQVKLHSCHCSVFITLELMTCDSNIIL